LLTLALGCGDDTGTPSSSSTGGDATSGAGGAGSSSSGGSPTSGSSSSSSSTTGTGGEGGEGGAAPPTTGVPGKELVNAGKIMTSPSYELHVTIGQPSPVQGAPTSANHKLRGGITGTTE
jgi:hypothetical protein